MATVYLAPFIGAGGQFFNNAGSSLSGGKIYTYTAGTTTPQATYTDNTGNTPQPNPIILDSSGRIPGGEVWITTALYKFVLQDSTGVTLATYDNVGITTTVLLSATPATSTTLGTVIVPVSGGGSVDGAGNLTIPGLKALTTLGDLPYVSTTGTPGTISRLAGNTTTTQKVLVQTGDGTNSAAPSWSSTPTFGNTTITGTLQVGGLVGGYNPGMLAGDVSANRGGGTGYFFFGSTASDKYLGFDGTNYVLNNGSLVVGGSVKLGTGHQETGYCGAGGWCSSTTQTNYSYAGTNFKTIMTNTPSSITLSAPIDSFQYGSSIAGIINVYGFRLTVISTNTTGGTFDAVFTYTTVGN